MVERRKSGAAGIAGSRGGRANEAGSLYRSGVAAYLAAHGLIGRGVEAAGYQEGGPAPVMLSLETGHAVDDIRCGLADGTTLWLQAKRTCGPDAQLRATAAQWVGQVGSLREGKVGLATAEPKGSVRDLGAALGRRRRSPQVAGPFPSRETTALEVLRDLLPPGTPPQTADRVMDAAIVMTVAASSSGDCRASGRSRTCWTAPSARLVLEPRRSPRSSVPFKSRRRREPAAAWMSG